MGWGKGAHLPACLVVPVQKVQRLFLMKSAVVPSIAVPQAQIFLLSKHQGRASSTQASVIYRKFSVGRVAAESGWGWIGCVLKARSHLAASVGLTPCVLIQRLERHLSQQSPRQG